jgi:hypothetical protein
VLTYGVLGLILDHVLGVDLARDDEPAQAQRPSMSAFVNLFDSIHPGEHCYNNINQGLPLLSLKGPHGLRCIVGTLNHTFQLEFAKNISSTNTMVRSLICQYLKAQRG